VLRAAAEIADLSGEFLKSHTENAQAMFASLFGCPLIGFRDEEAIASNRGPESQIYIFANAHAGFANS